MKTYRGSVPLGLTSDGQELDKVAVINILNIGIVTLHADLDPLGSPYTHTLGLQFCQMDTAGSESVVIDTFFDNRFLFPEETSGALNGNTPDFFFYHINHLFSMIQHVAAKRKMKNY